MTYTRTATLPVSPDEAFALITEPERLRRWMTVSAYVRALSEPIMPMARGRSFADEVPAPVDATPLDRLAAFAGRAKLAGASH